MANETLFIVRRVLIIKKDLLRVFYDNGTNSQLHLLLIRLYPFKKIYCLLSDVAQILEFEVPDEVFLEFFADNSIKKVSSDFVLEKDEEVNVGHIDVSLEDLLDHSF